MVSMSMPDTLLKYFYLRCMKLISQDLNEGCYLQNDSKLGQFFFD